MTDAFTGRPLDQVVIADFTVGRSRKSTMVAGKVFVSLSTPKGKPNGPSLQVDIGADIALSSSIEEAERKLLESAIAVARRIGEMSVDELHQNWVEWSKRATSNHDL